MLGYGAVALFIRCLDVLKRRKPCIRNQLMACRGGMHTIGQPIFRRLYCAGLVKYVLKRNEYLMKFCSNTLHCIGTQTDFMIELVPFFLCCSRVENKWLQHKELYLWKTFQRICKEHPIDSFKALGIYAAVMLHELMPDVVDSDKNANDIWLFIPRIRFDPRIDINNAATANTRIDELIFARFANTQLGIKNQRIALTN